MVVIPCESTQWHHGYCGGRGRACNHQNFNQADSPTYTKIEHISSTEALPCTCSDWLARYWSAQSSWGKDCLYGTVLDTCWHEKLHFTLLPKPDSLRDWDKQRTWTWRETVGYYLVQLSQRTYSAQIVGTGTPVYNLSCASCTSG